MVNRNILLIDPKLENVEERLKSFLDTFISYGRSDREYRLNSEIDINLETVDEHVVGLHTTMYDYMTTVDRLIWTLDKSNEYRKKYSEFLKGIKPFVMGADDVIDGYQPIAQVYGRIQHPIKMKVKDMKVEYRNVPLASGEYANYEVYAITDKYTGNESLYELAATLVPESNMIYQYNPKRNRYIGSGTIGGFTYVANHDTLSSNLRFLDRTGNEYDHSDIEANIEMENLDRGFILPNNLDFKLREYICEDDIILVLVPNETKDPDVEEMLYNRRLMNDRFNIFVMDRYYLEDGDIDERD